MTTKSKETATRSIGSPARLYKYRAVNPLSLAALEQGRAWYSKPEALNDPHDFRARWQKSFTDTEIIEEYVIPRFSTPVGEVKEPLRIRELVQRYRTALRDDTRVLKEIDKMFLKLDGKTQRQLLQDLLYYNEVIFSNLGVLSLSEESLQPLMWSHYSNSHRGFVLGLQFHETNVLGQFARPMDYVEKMPKPTIAGFQHDAGGEIVEMIAYSKDQSWAYEREWRVLTQTGDTLRPYPGMLEEIILGSKISAEDEIKVREAVSKSSYKPKFKRVVLAPDSFELALVGAD